MQKIMNITMLLILVGLNISCQNNIVVPATEPVQIELTPRAAELISSNNDFGVNLFTKTAIEENENMMLSPLSAGIALTMLLNGSDGATLAQLKEMLGHPVDMSVGDINKAYQTLVKQLLVADPQVTLAIANAIFYREDFVFKRSFMDLMADDFDANVEGLDFNRPEAVNTINKWAGDNTNNRIPKVIDQISPDMVMFLMNALYFKGDWSEQFNPENTAPKYFTLDNGEQILVSTMEGMVGAKKHHGDGFTAIELPYGRKNFSMVVVVPHEKLIDFYPKFTPQLWNEITTSLNAQEVWNQVLVNLPKFSFEYERFLNSQLKALGMVDAFNPREADLSGISDAELFVSFVKQNTFVEVSEEGTEAAAVTTIGVEVTSMPPYLFVNKPFIFAIRERTTNALLFMGSVTNPTK